LNFFNRSSDFIEISVSMALRAPLPDREFGKWFRSFELPYV
jgi:hypothetical protein